MVYRRHPSRIIPFANLDPRSGHSPEADFSWILEERIIPTILARVTTLYRVVEGGQTTETTTF